VFAGVFHRNSKGQWLPAGRNLPYANRPASLGPYSICAASHYSEWMSANDTTVREYYPFLRLNGRNEYLTLHLPAGWYICPWRCRLKSDHLPFPVAFGTNQVFCSLRPLGASALLAASHPDKLDGCKTTWSSLPSSPSSPSSLSSPALSSADYETMAKRLCQAGDIFPSV